MTKKEIIYKALGTIEGAACVAQKNIRDIILDATETIHPYLEELTEDMENNESGSKSR